MGYTHYWNREQTTIPKRLWRKFTSRLQPILDAHADLLSDVDVTDDIVFFNGQYETFVMPRVATRGSDEARELGDMWAFCKTARKPYDKVVVAALVLLATVAKGHRVGFTWSSDGQGEPGVHDEGIALSGCGANAVLATED